MNLRRLFKKVYCLLLVLLLTILPVLGESCLWLSLKTEAANVTVRQTGGNLLDGAAFDFYGHPGREGIFLWRDSNGCPVFCVEPLKAMQSGTGLVMEWYDMDRDWPASLSEEQKELLYYALAVAGCGEGNTNISTAQYIMVQSAIWAIVSGEWTTPEEFRIKMEVITARIKNNRDAVSQQIRSMADDFVHRIQTLAGDTDYIPAFATKPHESAVILNQMTEMGNGVYSVTFDELKPEVKDFEYDKPVGWDHFYSNDGKSITFVCDTGAGGNINEEMIGRPKPGTGLMTLKGPGSIGFYIPGKASNQIMIAQARSTEEWNCIVRFKAASPPVIPEMGEGSYAFESSRYEHNELFRSNYKIELCKVDAETANPLSDTTFSILESFDKNQLKGSGLSGDQFITPSELEEHIQLRTDENGSLNHGDEKLYDYTRTYCAGHPDPVVEKIAGIETESDDPDEIAAIERTNAEIDEKNRALEEEAWAAWQKAVDSCREETDFHSVTPGEAEEELEAERNLLFQKFIELEYTYTVREVQAKNGYILHDLHTADIPVPIISMKSSQAGGTGRRIGTYFNGEASYIVSKISDHSDQVEIHDKRNNKNVWNGSYETSEVNKIKQNQYKKDSIGFRFEIMDHRTEGEIHINKRDLGLFAVDEDESYGKSQGDATLEGAVYGLYAAEDIIHPDGKTGMLFQAGDLISVAATDKNGDASFLVITEESEASKQKMNLYTGRNYMGVDYPDFKRLNGSPWIGRPLFLGSYEISEISRSEGYELSQYGVQLTESNRKGSAATIQKSGSASTGGLSHPVNEWDGSWNEFKVKHFKTKQGFDIQISGYPSGSKFYKVKRQPVTENNTIVTGRTQRQRVDDAGNPVYHKASGGEYKYDAQGGRIPLLSETGDPLYDTMNPIKETFVVTDRLDYYPWRTATASDGEDYAQPADPAFVVAESNELFNRMGYKKAEEGAPSQTVPLSGSSNGDLVESILSWIAEDSFWDSYFVDHIYPDDEANPTQWYGVIRFAYTGIKGVEHFFDPVTERVIVRKTCNYSKNDVVYDGYCYLIYSPGSYLKHGSRVTLDKKVIDSLVNYGASPEFKIVYQPIYAVYEAGEYLLDEAGNKIPFMETVEHCDTEIVEGYEEVLTVMEAVYDPVSGIHKIHVPDDINWDIENGAAETVFRAKAPGKEKEGMAYADYIIQKAGGGVSVFSSKAPVDSGSYNKSSLLIYPGQTALYQDDGTRERPVIMLQRIIRQAVKVVKTISLSSYDEINTYSLHRDPFTVLYGGYHGKSPVNALPGFHFKIYTVADLERTGKLTIREDGGYDYKKFFEDKTNQTYFDDLAVEWDDPKNDADHDLTTLHANRKGSAGYYGTSIMLPYGTYVIVEQQPKEFQNKHYKKDDPKEVILPWVPHIGSDGQSYPGMPSPEYLYDSKMSPEGMEDRYLIRFNEECHRIQAQNRDGDFEVYKYGLSGQEKPEVYGNSVVGAYYKWESNSENGVIKDQVYYEILKDRDGNIEGYGITLDQVSGMKGESLAIDRKFASALIPWSILEPRYGEIINDDGDIGNRESGLEEDGSFNFVGYQEADFENTFYKSKLRIEKIDSETGENIIHEGAFFKIYAAKREVEENGDSEVTGSGQVVFDENGIPVYDESEQIFMEDERGSETGIFKAFTTVKEVITQEEIRKVPVGYIETSRPLGAGVYVLVEVEAPSGYIKSDPVAFEVYSDEVAYYYNGKQDDRRTARQYQYAIPFTDTKMTVSQIIVEDEPTRIEIHKTEGGAGTKTFEVRGSKEQLEARGDVSSITYDPVSKDWYGTVTKVYDEWSETLVYGTEQQLRSMGDVKLLYSPGGVFTGRGIRYGIYVEGAGLTLFHGLKVTRLPDGGYYGVEPVMEGDKVVGITASHTGTHTELNTNEKDGTPGKKDVWDTQKVENPPLELLFYDLKEVLTEVEPDTGTVYILDGLGNRICMADPETGMAYVEDHYGNMIVYPVDKDGRKMISRSIKVQADVNGNPVLYSNKQAVTDENGLPVYYENAELNYDENTWVTGGKGHAIARLPLGAYILEETKVPYAQGYIGTQAIGLIVEEEEEEQRFFLDDDFTKIEIPKLDIRTREEIPDAKMTLYYGIKVDDGSEKGFHLEYQINESGEKRIRTSWISGYAYDDNGDPVLDENGNLIPSTGPHWIDHIPVGCYILEESGVPYEYGYVQAEPVEIIVEESGEIQSFPMEDDYTQIEILKVDTGKGKPLANVGLTLYRALLNEDGTVAREDGNPREDRNEKILSWYTGDGRETAATAHPVRNPDTGELVFDDTGEPLIGYHYNIRQIPSTLRGRYYQTETGAVHFDYLPVGFYVLIEEDTPIGYATEPPLLVEVKEVGGTVEVQKSVMDNFPLEAEFSKVNLSRGSVIAGAVLRVYEAFPDGSLEMIEGVDENGFTLYEENENGELVPVRIYNPAYLKYEWETGKDGIYGDNDEIPAGAKVGDLKPHTISHIPSGDYFLVECKTPYGFLTSEPVAFTIMDKKGAQKVEMTDPVPNGQLEIIKYDASDSGVTLPKAEFLLKNETLGVQVEILVTGEDGKAVSQAVLPIGYLNEKGTFSPYVYSVKETAAPDDYMLQPLPHYFEFQYKDGKTDGLVYRYHAFNEPNQVMISKKMLTGQEELPGAHMRLEKISTVIDEVSEEELRLYEVFEEWISQSQSHYINGIPNGKYRLLEIETPGDGFVMAEPVEFEIAENMTEIPVITMYDEHTTVEIQKTASDTGKHLAGAKLQIIDSKGEIRDTFITAGESSFMYGLEPGSYVLKELQAPEGYDIAQPIEFQVTDQYEIQVIKMVDRLRTTGKGGGKPKKPYISKVDASTGKKLSGAWIVIYNPDGSLYTKGRTDTEGNFYFETPPAGIYTYQEVEAPDGYFLNDSIFTFRVDSKGNITGSTVLKNVKKQTVILNKKDALNKEGIFGAEIEVYDEKGLAVFRGNSDGKGRVSFIPPKTGEYTFKEVKAPDGYKRTDSIFTFIIYPDGSITGEDTILNEPVFGYVTAYYEERMNEHRRELDKGEPDKMVWPPKLGDSFSFLLISVLSAGSSCIVFFLCRKRFKKSRTDKKHRNR